jgi:O-antigen/teichoic acid export membrane protein
MIFPRDSFLVLFHRYFSGLRVSSLVRNILKVLSGDILAKIFGVGKILLLIRGLTVNDYAAYTAFFAILTLIPGLVGNGVNLALVRFSAEHISKTAKKPYTLYITSFVFQFITYGLFCIILLLFSQRVTDLLFGMKDYDVALQFGLIAGFGLLVSQVGRSIYQAEERFGLYIRTLWLRQITALVIIFCLFLMNRLNFQNVVLSIIAVELGVGFIITVYIFKNFNFRKVTEIFLGQSDIIRDFLSSTGWLIAYFFALAAFARLDIFMLSHFSTQYELANYGVAFRYYSLALLVLGSIHAVLLPRFSKVDMQNVIKQRQFALKWLRMTVALIVPLGIVLAVSRPLFIWINGAQYARAFYILLIFAIGIWLSLMLSPLVNILRARKAFRFLFLLAVGAFVVNLTGNYFLIPIWGGFGAAIITILSYGLINITSGIRVFSSSR